jgi:hypothetical protein
MLNIKRSTTATKTLSGSSPAVEGTRLCTTSRAGVRVLIPQRAESVVEQAPPGLDEVFHRVAGRRVAQTAVYPFAYTRTVLCACPLECIYGSTASNSTALLRCNSLKVPEGLGCRLPNCQIHMSEDGHFIGSISTPPLVPTHHGIANQEMAS